MEAFREVANEVIYGDDLSVELWSMLSIELRGEENGCPFGAAYCSTTGSFTIPNGTEHIYSRFEINIYIHIHIYVVPVYRL